MRAHEQTYEAVAKKCSSYKTKQNNSMSNSTGSDNVSCTTCSHFTDNSYCELDLYDQIVSNHGIIE